MHTTPRRRSASGSPFLHAAAGKARPSGSHLCSAAAAVAVAMAVSPSRCLAQAAWVLESLLWKPERGAGSKWQAEGSEGRTLSYSADKPSSRVPSWRLESLFPRPLLSPLASSLLPPLAPSRPLFFVLLSTLSSLTLTPHASPSHRSPTATARTPTASPPKQPNIQTTPSAADSALFHRLRPAVSAHNT